MLVGFEIAGKFGVVDLPRTVFATGCRQARCQQLPTSVIRHQVALAPEIDGRVELPADDDACRQAMPTATHSYSRTSPTSKDGGVLRTIGDAHAYIMALPKKRALRAHWQHAGRLILQQASAAALTRQVHLALFMDGKLDTGAFEHMAALGDGSAGRDGGSAERKERGFLRHDQGEATDRHGC